MWSWHLVQVSLHAGCAVFLFLLAVRLLADSPLRDEPARITIVAFAAALIHTLHPVNAGVVDYISARSTLQTSFFLLLALLCHDRSRRSGSGRWSRVFATLFYTCALFTKGEAVAFLAVIVFWEWLNLSAVAKSRWRRIFAGVLLYAVVTTAYLAVRLPLIRGYEAAAARRWDVGPWEYALTQITTPWHYLGRWLAPIDLIADNLVYPVSRQLWDPKVLLALAAWGGAVALVLKRVQKPFPAAVFLVGAGWFFMAPTSSVFPLAEMVNEHRPYLAIPFFTLPLFAAVGIGVRRPLPSGVAVAGVVCGGLWISGLSLFTWQRTRVFLTEEAYWGDLVQHAPAERAELNYGRILMRKGQLDDAERYFRRALERTRDWALLHSNMAWLLEQKGEIDEARAHHDLAVSNDRFTSISLFNRGCFRYRQGDYAGAIEDFSAALDRSNDPLPIHAEIGKAYAAMGDADNCFRQTEICYRISPERTSRQIVEMTRPFWRDESQYEAGLQYYRRLLELYPRAWWAHDNVGGMLGNLGRDTEAAPYLEKARELRAAGTGSVR